MAAGGTPGNVTLGPGRLYYAPIGTSEPASCSAALPSAWKVIGYTEEGTEVSTDMTVEDIEVAEELDPISSAITGRTGTLEFKMAQATRKNLYLALNKGASTTNDATTLEPPDPSAMVRVMLLHVSNDAGAVRGTLFRQCFNVGGLEMDFSKAPKKVLQPVTFKLEKPTSKTPFIVFPNASGIIA